MFGFSAEVHGGSFLAMWAKFGKTVIGWIVLWGKLKDEVIIKTANNSKIIANVNIIH